MININGFLFNGITYVLHAEVTNEINHIKESYYLDFVTLIEFVGKKLPTFLIFCQNFLDSFHDILPIFLLYPSMSHNSRI